LKTDIPPQQDYTAHRIKKQDMNAAIDGKQIFASDGNAQKGKQMQKLIITLLVFVGLISTSAFAEDTPVLNVTVGVPFNISLGEGKSCSSLNSYDQINLLINSLDTGLHPLGCDPATQKLAFEINRDEAPNTRVANAAWQIMLGMDAKHGLQRDLSYTVTQPASTDELKNIKHGSLKLLIASPAFIAIGVSLSLLLLISLVYLGRNSGMLRDAGNQGDTLQHRTYSLGLVQMAWWFGIVMGSYMFLWIITKGIPPLSSQALLLMGISGATGLTSVGLNAGMKKAFPVGTQGEFFEDLLTDANGVTLHRFQMLAITVILGVMFIIHVVTNLSMPEFDGSLLTLMGIAGGTYVGFKIPENFVNPPNPPATDPPATQ
jgi:hypothetical protein